MRREAGVGWKFWCLGTQTVEKNPPQAAMLISAKLRNMFFCQAIFDSNLKFPKSGGSCARLKYLLEGSHLVSDTFLGSGSRFD